MTHPGDSARPSLSARAAAIGGLALTLAWSVGGLATAAQAVRFRAADGIPLAASVFETSHRPSPGVVLVHMLTRSRADWVPFAERLADAGITAVAVDLRGHGESGGTAAELASMERDVTAAVAYLRSRGDVQPGRVAIVGASLGASLATAAAAADPSLRALVLLSPATDYRGVRCEAALRKFAGPVLLVAGANDPYALRSIRQLAETGSSREVQTLEAGGHGTVMLQRTPELTGMLVDWLRRALL